jgi:hypothetical protein
MRRAFAIAFVGLASGAPAYADSWTCSAPGMASGSYDGGATAYIHLTAFNTGSNYPVKKSGNRATGVTKNGTKFTCVKS